MEFAKLKLPVSDPEKLQKLQKIIPKKYSSILQGKSPYKSKSAEAFAIEAVENGNIEGVCLASLHRKRKIAEIHTATVKNFSGLLQKAEELLASEDIEVVSFLFASEDLDSLQYKEVLEKRGWSRPRYFQITLNFDSRSFNPPWFEHVAPLPLGYSIFPWASLKESEKEKIKYAIEQRGLSPILSPFSEEEFIQPINSLGLRFKERVIGWMITHTFPDNPDKIRYSSLFIEEEFRQKGVAAALLMQSIKRQKNSPVRWSSCEINCDLSEEAWIRFVQTRLYPYTTSIEHVLRSGKNLTEG